MRRVKKESRDKNIVLTGFMGTGKNAVGKILARRLERNFIDTDQLVEEKSGISITQIFEQHGEDYFRDLENEAILTLKDYPPGSLVVATGGGAVLRKRNRDLLDSIGLVILLTASPQSILKRTARSDKRPLLKGPGRAEKINKLLKEREQFYKQCSYSIDTTGLTPTRIAEEILNYLSKV